MTTLAPVREKVTRMKPSEALRLGSLVTQQAFGSALDEQGRMCAAGTIADVDERAWEHLRYEPEVPCPSCGRTWDSDLGWIVIHLNDGHRWTRPEIAAFLESLGL